MAEVFASGLITETSGYLSGATTSTYDRGERKVMVTRGIEYKNNNDHYISGNVVNTYNSNLSTNGTTSTQIIFQPTGFYATGVGVVQGSLIAVSGYINFLEVNPTGNCSVAQSDRDILLLRNNEALGGYTVHFGTPATGGEKGGTSTVNKVEYNDVYLDMGLRPQEEALLHTGGSIDTLVFVAGTGRMVTTNPKATVSYTLFPR
jgi:hypothetical protein